MTNTKTTYWWWLWWQWKTRWQLVGDDYDDKDKDHLASELLPVLMLVLRRMPGLRSEKWNLWHFLCFLYNDSGKCEMESNPFWLACFVMSVELRLWSIMYLKTLNMITVLLCWFFFGLPCWRIFSWSSCCLVLHQWSQFQSLHVIVISCYEELDIDHHYHHHLSLLITIMVMITWSSVISWCCSTLFASISDISRFISSFSPCTWPSRY